jgi:anaerobic selenocysteine-containing dehydrogenase
MAPRGLYTAMAIHALNGLLGSTESPGGPCRQPSVPTAGTPSVTSFMDAIATTGYATTVIGASGTLSMPGISGSAGYGKTTVTNDLPNAMLAAPNAVKVCIANWSNFAFSCCDTSRWHSALSALPFLVHITTNASETSQFADILLPAAHPTTERFSFLKNHGNLYSEAGIQQPLVTRLFDVRSDENEISYCLAEKLATLGFTNILDYYNASFVNPDTLVAPTNYSEFAEFATMKYLKPIYDTFAGGWTEYKSIGVKAYGPAAYQANWANFGTVTGKFEFYSETLKAKLQAHATHISGTTVIDDVLAACNYLATGDLGFVPHYEPPLRHGALANFPLTFIDSKSRYNREGRSANSPFYYQFKKLDPGDENWSDVIKINPIDAATYGITDGALVNVTSETGTLVCKAKLWEGVRPGTVAKAYGQGHWAYGRFASDYANLLPKGGNNNDILFEDYERISGSTARNGGFVGVNITLV